LIASAEKEGEQRGAVAVAVLEVFGDALDGHAIVA
jgi:hypothetical protein